MRRLLIPLVLGVFLTIVSVYLLRTLNPFETEAALDLISAEKVRTISDFSFLVKELMQKGLIWDYINLRNFLLTVGAASAAYIAWFTFLHLVLDKLFFRKFYQLASMSMAIRRGVLSALALLGFMVLQMYGLELYISGLWPVLLLIVEILTWKFFQPEVDPETAKDKSTFKQGVGLLRNRLEGLRGKVRLKLKKGSVQTQKSKNGELRIENEDDSV